MLSLEQIQAAQANDLGGISAVLDAMDSRLTRLASRTAGRLATNPARYADYAEDFRQDAAVSLFEHLPRWEGDSVDDFMAFVYRCVQTDLDQRLYAERNPGIDRNALSVFKDMVGRASGDLALAEQMAQTVPPVGTRLSAERAHAARLSWQGATALDDDAKAIPAEPSEIAEEIRPKVGHGAALVALSVLGRCAGVTVSRMAPRMFAANLPTLVATLEESLSVPREPGARRAVLGAMAILRSAVSTADEAELPEDLRSVADINSDQRAERIGSVRAVIGGMTGRVAQQAEALRFSYGIDGYPSYGAGRDCDLEGLARALVTTPAGAKITRIRAHATFTKRYIDAVATSETHAATLSAAAAANVGRK
ncbi:hypothetical protein PV729_04390 [Streptomyces europaeiscabiei]|uniref:Uncharacterized protein n=1 Tax=Streptomyces europaeiscabiei TaxID=146819 RepID=A0ABU4N6L6_9ACTN|nr:hypothetical protein [Streptomyces europaeiscabiei]MDX3551017.1 hypothetical protein [Streptomyces europaeiscabiei]MDX3698423.1 hypothetical protein [Streptomyces europaeiscabiei]